MRYARQTDDAIVEVIDLPPSVELADAFHQDIAALFFPVAGDVEERWVRDGAGWAPPPAYVPSLAERQAALIYEIDARRDLMVAAGAPIGGLHVAIGDGSRADMGAMATTALAAASDSTPWPASYAVGWIAIENVRIPLPAPADGLALAATVGDWYARIVQHARSLKDAVLAAEDVAALDAIDIEAGWPIEEA